MPPKQSAPPPVQHKLKNFSIHCTLRNHENVPPPVIDPTPENTELLTPIPLLSEGYRLRICSKWSNCSVMTPLIGDKAMPWVLSGDGLSKTIDFSYQFDGEVDSTEQLSHFHESPHIFVFIFFVTHQEIKMSSFFSIDCSNFLLESSTSSACRSINNTIDVSVSVSNEKPVSEMKMMIPLEPVRLRFKGLSSFPIYRNEGENEAIVDTYLFGSLQLGPNLHRDILVFPSNTQSAKESIDSSGNVKGDTIKMNSSTSISTVKHPINQNVVLLPGLDNVSRFHDIIASSTFTINLFQDDLLNRCYSGGNWAEYTKLLTQEPGGLALPAPPVVASNIPEPTNTKAKKPAPAAGKPVAASTESASFSPTPTSSTPSDRFLIQCISEEVRKSSTIRDHGEARFRLEQLLQQSNDLLTKFKKRRGEMNNPEDNHVVVREELLLEVRLQQASQPQKWSLPSDLSLKHALNYAKAHRGKSEPLRVVKSPPRHELFLVNGTYLSVTAELHRHLHERAQQIDSASPFPVQLTLSCSTKEQRHLNNLDDAQLAEELKHNPFTRMVITMRYDNDEALTRFNDGLQQINSRSLPDIQGSIRSYSLTEAETQAAMDGTLDVISGFMVIDDELRIIVIEGLAAPDKAMEWMFLDFLPKLKDNDDDLSILVNPEILFPERMYPTYSPDIKRIRVRGKLKKLARRPEIYSRLQVDEICFMAVDRLMALSRAQDMRSAKKLDIFPSSESLDKLELLYGEAISRSDMDGTLKNAFAASVVKHRSRKDLRSSSPSSPTSPNEKDKQHLLPSNSGKRLRDEFKFTDCRNPDFELHLRTRPVHRIDYLAEQRALRKQAWLGMLHRRDTRDKELTKTIRTVLGLENPTSRNASRSGRGKTANCQEKMEKTAEEPLPKVYLYAGQSENFKEKAWNQLRDKIANDHSATYTFSKDFMSQTVSAVDESREKKKQAAQEKASWLTEKGFQYPKPKSIKEMLTHPKKPSNARVEELKEPFLDRTDIPPNVNNSSPEVVAREKGFRTQVNGTTVFGALEVPVFEHDFQLKYVGDREHLPRGRQLNEGVPDPQFFRSVHLGGENQTRIVEEALEKEKELWQSKVVVDDVSFKVGKMSVRDVPIQSEKCCDILHDEPRRKELIYLRERHGHKGTSMSHTTAPLSILNFEPYAPNAGQKLLARVADASKFITAKITHGESFSGLLENSIHADATQQRPKDFTRFIHEGTDKPKIVTMVAKRKHPPQDASERHGPKWDAVNV